MVLTVSYECPRCRSSESIMGGTRSRKRKQTNQESRQEVKNKSRITQSTLASVMERSSTTVHSATDVFECMLCAR